LVKAYVIVHILHAKVIRRRARWFQSTKPVA